jgi:hypothetical protein
VAFGAILAACVTALGLKVPATPQNLPLAIVAACFAAVAAGSVFALGAWVQLSGPTLRDLKERQTFVEARTEPTANEDERWRRVAAADDAGCLEHLWMNGLCSPGHLHAVLRSGSATDEDRETLTMMLRTAEEWEARRRFRPLVIATYLALPLTLVAVALTAWGWREAGRPNNPGSSKPVPVMIHLATTAKDAGIPDTCVKDGAVRGIAIGGTWDEPTVLIVPSTGCPTQAVRVTDAVGDAVPE